MTRWLIVFLAPVLAAMQEAGQEMAGAQLEVESVERSERGFQATIRGVVDVKERTQVWICAVPLAYQVAADGATLVPWERRRGAPVPVRAWVKEGAIRTRILARSPLEHRVLLVPVAGDAPIGEAVLHLFEPTQASSRLLSDLRTLDKQIWAVEDFLTRLEPFEKSGEKVPMELAEQRCRIEEVVRPWSETADLSASSLLLATLLTHVGATVPWDCPPMWRGLEDSGYPIDPNRPDEREAEPFRVETFRRRLEFVRRIAARESELLVVVPLLHKVERMLSLPTEAQKKAALNSIQTLRRMQDSIEGEGVVGEFLRASEALLSVRSFLEGAERRTQDLLSPEIPVEQAEKIAEELRKLRQEIVSIRGLLEGSPARKKDEKGSSGSSEGSKKGNSK